VPLRQERVAPLEEFVGRFAVGGLVVHGLMVA
jgi:hypothetical protein